MTVSGLLGRGNLSRIDVRVETPDELYAQSAAPLRITLVNTRLLLPAFLVKVRVDDTEVLFPYVDAGAEETRRVHTVFARRGRVLIETVSFSSVFPFNFFVRSKRIGRVTEATVFPRPRACALDTHAAGAERRRGERRSNLLGYEGEMVSLRTYVHGDPLKYIHWKASAKTGVFKTKELSADAEEPVVIDFDAMGPADREEKLSCAAYMILSLLKRNVPAGLKIGGNAYAPGLSNAHKRLLLKELALYGTE